MSGLSSVEPVSFRHAVSGFCRTVATLGLPHCVLGDEGDFRGAFFPIIKQEFSGSTHIARHTPSAWGAQAFRDWVAASGRRKIVLGGISLDNRTGLTAIDLMAAGFEAYVVVDVSGAENEVVERASLLRLMQAGAVPISWVQFACEVMDDWRLPEGPAIAKLVQAHSRYGALGASR